MHRIVLVTGGARSGKSRYAMDAARPYQRRAFIATAIPFDEEMKDRIAKHRADRRDEYLTIEEPVDLASAIAALPPGLNVALIDCLTVWLGNLVHHYGPETSWFPEIDAFLDVLARPPCNMVIVTNEVGMGIVPDNPMARAFRDLAGRANALVAAAANEVVLLVSGIPVVIKPGPSPG